MTISYVDSSLGAAVASASTQAAQIALHVAAFSGDVTVKYWTAVGGVLLGTATWNPWISDLSSIPNRLVSGGVKYVSGSAAWVFAASGVATIAEYFDGPTSRFRTDVSFSGPVQACAPPIHSGSYVLTASVSKPASSGVWGADAPSEVVLEDWTTGVGVVVGTNPFNASMPDLVLTDPTYSASMGVVNVKKSTSSIVWAGFEFGAIAFRGENLKIGGGEYFSVLGTFKPAGRWATYPFMDTYAHGTDSTHPPAFKIRIKKSDGTDAGVIAMSDGLPINSPLLSKTRNATLAFRPRFNIGQTLIWRNAKTKANTSALTKYPKFDPSYRASLAHAHFSTNPPIGAVITTQRCNARAQVNGVNHWYQMAMTPLPCGAGGGAGNAYSPSADPYGYDPSVIYTGDAGTPSAQSCWLSGLGYEPGANGGHEWLTGPGGSRFSRAGIATPIAHYLSNQAYVRPKGGEPIRDLCDHWTDNYANHSCHWHTDVKNFTSYVQTNTERRTRTYRNSYYNQGGALATDDKSIDLRGVGNGSYSTSTPGDGGVPDSQFEDSTGDWLWGCWELDLHHSSQWPADGVTLFNYPEHIVTARNLYNAHRMSLFGDNRTWYRDYFANRVHAWRMLQLCRAWMVGTDHPLGISRSDALQMFIEESGDAWDQIGAPIMAATTSIDYKGLTNLGFLGNVAGSGSNNYISANSNATDYYFAVTFALLKTSGMWPHLIADAKTNNILMLIFNMLCKRSIDMILDAPRWQFESTYGQNRISVIQATSGAVTAADIPASWADWSTMIPPIGSEGFLQNAAGAWTEHYAPQHMVAQWAYVVNVHFPEHAYPRVAAAVAAYDAIYNGWAAQHAAGGPELNYLILPNAKVVA